MKINISRSIAPNITLSTLLLSVSLILKQNMNKKLEENDSKTGPMKVITSDVVWIQFTQFVDVILWRKRKTILINTDDKLKSQLITTEHCFKHKHKHGAFVSSNIWRRRKENRTGMKINKVVVSNVVFNKFLQLSKLIQKSCVRNVYEL